MARGPWANRTSIAIRQSKTTGLSCDTWIRNIVLDSLSYRLLKISWRQRKAYGIESRSWTNLLEVVRYRCCSHECEGLHARDHLSEPEHYRQWRKSRGREEEIKSWSAERAAQQEHGEWCVCFVLHVMRVMSCNVKNVLCNGWHVFRSEVTGNRFGSDRRKGPLFYPRCHGRVAFCYVAIAIAVKEWGAICYW